MKVRFAVWAVAVVAALSTAGAAIKPLSEELTQALYPPELRGAVDLAALKKPAITATLFAEIGFTGGKQSRSADYARHEAQCWAAAYVLDAYESPFYKDRPRSLADIRASHVSLWTLPLLSEARITLKTKRSQFGGSWMANRDEIRKTAQPGDMAISQEDVQRTTEDARQYSYACAWRDDKGVIEVLSWNPWRRGPSALTAVQYRAPEKTYTPEAWAKDGYWTSMEFQILRAGSRYRAMNGGAMPRTLEDLEQVMGPRNPNAWTEVVDRWVREFLAVAKPKD